MRLFPLRSLATLCTFAALSSSFPLRAHAGEPDPADPAAELGSLVGSVRTSDGLALPHVAVGLRGPAGSARVTTGPDGAFRVARLVPGEYDATVDAPGLELRSPTRAAVAGGTTRLDLVLVAAPVREHVVVSATRGEATSSTLGVAADVLDRERIEERAAPTLLTLLQELPGVASARSGATGRQASVFIRGGESRFARVLVDGVPLNQPGGAFDFGAALPFELEAIEVVRGAASSLYGSDALAGVVSLTTRRAAAGAGPSLRLEGEGGGFGWRRASGASAGTRGRLDWNLGAQRLTTDNAEPNSAFEATALALTAGARLPARLELRAVGRFDDSAGGTPGPTAFGRAELDASFERRDLVVSTQLRQVGLRHDQRLGVSLSRTRQRSFDPLDSGPWTPTWQGLVSSYGELSDYPQPEGYLNRTSRLLASYQATLSLGSRHLVSTGIDVEQETGEIGGRPEDRTRPERTNAGLYVQDRVLLGERVYLTAGGRIERNGSSGTHAVPRAAVAVRLRGGEDATTLRASAGMGIKEPSFLESYGSPFNRSNPDLDPERSTTFDLGVEQRLFASRLRAAVTAFQHAYGDQIAYTVVDYTTYEGQYVNLARTRSRGVEIALEGRPLPALRLSGQYTFQDGEILESPSDFDPVYAVGQPLLRRPRHQGALSAVWSFARGSLGATLVRVGRRADGDFYGLGLTENPGYTRLDARARLRLAGPFEAFAAADNLLDASYQEALGYAALGRSLRAGLRLAWKGRR